MAKKVIVLDRNDGQPVTFNVAFWLTVPTGRETFYARPGAKSAWKGAAQAEIDAIVAGQVVEQIDSVTMPPGATVPQIEADLEARWTARQNDLTNSQAPNRYGSFWDGTTWTILNN